MGNPEKARLHATLDGRVQGVGFRAFVMQQAQNLGLSGWVRNRWNGSVEVLAEGSRDVLETFLSLLRRGPRSSYVSDLDFDWSEFQGDLSGFFVRRTE
jgi:acylphosphatase